MTRASVLLALLIAAPAHAGPAEYVELALIDQAAHETKTLSAEFTQKNRMKLFKQELTSRGRLYFEAPRRIRWEYTAPDPSVLVLDGTRATMRSPGAPTQVFDLEKDATMRAIFDQLLIFVGGGVLAAREAYSIEVRTASAEPMLVLTPKPGGAIAKTFSRIELGFNAGLLVHRIELVEQNGDEKEIIFGKVERNRPLPAHAFE